jgi:hypothetical protein
VVGHKRNWRDHETGSAVGGELVDHVLCPRADPLDWVGSQLVGELLRKPMRRNENRITVTLPFGRRSIVSVGSRAVGAT